MQMLFKTLIVSALALLIYVPLTMIQSTISERIVFHTQAVNSIATDSVREQTLIGPILTIPYTDEYMEEEVVTGTLKTRTVKRSISKRLVVFPNDLKINSNIDTDHRYRGIHKVLVYSGRHELAGDFLIPDTNAIKPEKPGSTITIGKPFVSISVSDVRGIKDIPKLNWGGKNVDFQQGSELVSFSSGVHAQLDTQEVKSPGQVKFSFSLELDGIERLHFTPVAKNNHVQLVSKWPHPQYGGRFLPSPKRPKPDANGFSASWNISSLATDTQQQLTRLETTERRQGADNAAAIEVLDRFGVGFIEPVNIYSQADRAVKYGLLFVALTFAAFFLFELLKQLPIHPVQYTLVGMALALFFLLLVSLSEHIQFVHSYLISSCACILLIGFYLVYVLRDWKRGFGFACVLTALYGVLYGLLRSENNALVMGSILLFAVLSAIMIATRKVDWYQIGQKRPGNLV